MKIKMEKIKKKTATSFSLLIKKKTLLVAFLQPAKLKGDGGHYMVTLVKKIK